MEIATLNDKVKDACVQEQYRSTRQRERDGIINLIFYSGFCVFILFQHDRKVQQLEHDFSLQTAQHNEVSLMPTTQRSIISIR